jgi:PadR family transcriptional regulator PadR
MDSKMRRSPQTTLVLAEFLQAEREWRYGYDLSRATGLKSGTLYPILMRLAERGMLETSWETGAEVAGTGRPPRHIYKLTRDGLRYAQAEVAAAKAAEKAARSPSVRPALGEVTS